MTASTASLPRKLTGHAALTPVTDDGRQAVVFDDGLVVWVYVDPHASALVVSVDLGGLDPASPVIRDNGTDGGTVRVRIDLNGMVVFDDTDEARASGTVVDPSV